MARIAVVFRRLGPYHHARLRAAGRVMEVTGIELTGCDKVYAWDKVEGAEGFRRVSLFPEQDIETLPAKTFFGRLTQELTNANPEAVVVPGWSESGSLVALQWCASRQVPAVVMSESTAWDEKRSGWKEWMKSRVVRLCAAGLVGGRAHADYLEQLGIERTKIFFGYDAVDNDYFAAKTQEVRSQSSGKGLQDYETTGPQDRRPVVSSPRKAAEQPRGEQSSVVRSRYGLPENYFLASARFVEKKNLPRLIEAYARYRELAGKSESGKQPGEVASQRLHGPGKAESTSPQPSPQSGEGVTPWDLVLLGDGPLRETLNSQLRKGAWPPRGFTPSALNLHEHVHLPGFKQYDELPAYYGLASAFVHASTTESWGLVVNEAMASGLPVLVSNRCGCAQDLVQEGKNGFTFEPWNVEALAQLMLKISAFNFPLSEFGLMSREIISAWGPDRFANGLKQAVECALRVGPVKPTLLQRMILKALLWK